MGNFKVPNREIVIMLEGDFAGAEIVCKQDVSIGTFLEMQKMSSNDDTIVESYKKFGNDILLRWNLVDDKEKPMTSGLFRLKAGESLKYTYTYHEMKFIVDGSFTIEDETGQKVEAKPGDLFYFPKGTAVTFTTSDFGLGFFCGQRGEGEA